jgi:hypothetical protein
MIFTILDRILTREFRNNDNNTKFQYFLNKVIKILKDSSYKTVHRDLLNDVKNTYQTNIIDNEVDIIRKSNKYTQQKIRKIKNLIDLIKNLEFNKQNKSIMFV